jgi:fibronectin type 3 domain-containing protein
MWTDRHADHTGRRLRHRRMIRLTWKAGAGASAYELWRSATNDSATATKIADVTGNTYVDTAVVEGATYYYWVKAVNLLGTSGFSAGTGAIVAGKTLSPPTGALSSIDDEDAITVTWAAVAGATKYDVWRHTTENFAAATKVGSNVVGTSFDDTTATANTFYVYWIVAKNDVGNESNPSLATGGFVAPALPAVPAGVSASDDQANQVTVSWTAAARAERYEIWRHTSNSSAGATKIGHTTALSFVDDSATVGVTYYYWVKAINYTGWSGFSASDAGVATAPIPLPPANVTATRGVGKVTVEADPADYATTYSVWRHTSDVTGAATQIASGLVAPYFEDTTGVPETGYFYWFKASNATGTSGFSASADAAAQIAAPTGVAASSNVVGKVVVTWNAVAHRDGYEVWRSTTNDSGTATQIAAGLTATTYDDTTVVQGVVYYYWLKAVKGATPSPFSASDSGETAIPPAPTGVNATTDLTDRITVSWDSVSGASGYEIRVATVNNFASSTLLTTVSAAELSTDHFGTPEGSVRYYWVIATVSGIQSAPSAVASGYVLGVPDAPTGVDASNGVTGFVEVIWTPNGADSYAVYRNTSNTPVGATLLEAGIVGSAFYDYPSDDGAYYYFVRATNAAGSSGYSAGDLGYAALPTAPTGVNATDSDTSKVTVSWNPVAGADSYKVYRHTSNSFAAATFVGDFYTTDFEDTDPVVGTTYYYWVLSQKHLLLSAPSSPDTGLRPGIAPDAPTSVSASDTLVGQVSVSWDPSVGATSYSIWRNTVLNPATATQIATGVSGSPYSDTTAVPDTPYFYWVQAHNAYGDSPFSGAEGGYALQPLRGLNVTGGDEGLDRDYYATDNGSHAFTFDAFTLQDRLEVIQAGTTIYDTGCISGQAIFSTTLFFAGAVRLRVTPNCAGGSGTAWQIIVS